MSVNSGLRCEQFSTAIVLQSTFLGIECFMSPRRHYIDLNAIRTIICEYVNEFSEGYICLRTSGNYTQVEILTGNS